MARREHLNDYVVDEDGNYSYAGLRWAWPSDEGRANFVRRAWVFLVVSFACIVIAGFIPAPGSSGALYVVIPYAASVLATALVTLAVIRLTQEQNPLRNHIYEKSVPALGAKLIFASLSALLCAIAVLVHAFVFDSKALVLSFLFALCMLLAAASLWFLRQMAKQLHFEKLG